MTPKRLTTARKLRLRSIAKDIADDLFTFGVNERASRLVQVAGTPERALGGWSNSAVTGRIYKFLLEAEEKR